MTRASGDAPSSSTRDTLEEISAAKEAKVEPVQTPRRAAST